MTQIKASQAVQEQAIKVAKATQKPGQTKEQTKLIAQGIEKGIAEYKKQQSKKNRERDKLKKQELKLKTAKIEQDTDINNKASMKQRTAILPWSLLILSWLSFIIITWYI